MEGEEGKSVMRRVGCAQLGRLAFLGLLGRRLTLSSRYPISC